jgi:hypothetical protein
VGDLLTFPEGNEFYWISVPEKLVGVRFMAAMSILKQNYDALAVAISSDQLGGPFRVSNQSAGESRAERA